jgi:riboflavin kinase / FMN adenylyltransferase
MVPNQNPPQTSPFLVARDGAQAREALGGAVLAIGNFDGVHRGHRAVIEAAIHRARLERRPAAALTFEPHPRRFFRPDRPLFRLTDEQAKLRLLAATDLEGAFVMTFDAALAELSAEAFVAEVLIEQLAVAGVTVGFDFHFGKDRRGTPAFLAEQGRRLGFPVEILPPLEDEGRPVSSSAIRAALAAGRVVEAAELLDYPWFVTASVVAGDRRGRELGFPTANLRLDANCALKHGIYAVRVGLDGQIHDAVASFGRRPTFDNGAPLLEVHLFDFAADLYGRSLDVALIGWIRAEWRFDEVESLVDRMHVDAHLARLALARSPGLFPPLARADARRQTSLRA